MSHSVKIYDTCIGCTQCAAILVAFISALVVHYIIQKVSRVLAILSNSISLMVFVFIAIAGYLIFRISFF